MLDKHLVEVGCVGNGMLAMGRGINMSIHKSNICCTKYFNNS